jgi:aminoglycoside phosphotransferase (APT) family kinase protein
MTVDAKDLRVFAADAVRDAGLVGADEDVSAEELPGGVSNDVVVVRAGESAYVVKRALPRLRVAEVWEASAERSFTEAAALRWAATIAPEAVPDVVAIDRSRHAIVIELAPDTYANWKQTLLTGVVRPAVGGRLGALLAAWHVASAADAALLDHFDDQEAFGQLRVTPFYRVAAERNPEAAPAITELVERMRRTRTVLVHGDFSPKNILVDAESGDDLWVIDWEVTHAGDPTFDVAFLLHHLVCKAVALPRVRSDLLATAIAFLDAYEAGTRDVLGPPDHSYLMGHVAALVLARVDGKSPVDYLAETQRHGARSLALSALSKAPADLAGLWRLIDDI